MMYLNEEPEVNAMYQFEKEAQRKEKTYKIYVVLFVISALINVILMFTNDSILRGVVSLLLFSIILYHGLKKKDWAELIVKFVVWIHIFLLLIIILTLTIK
ncbi:hypothetical protein [Peribacillus sp. SCS-155]|uniref:hypothetical protein n=1 Tax=Peribacillus sedimenti TaxID=3115297 RepID=UPI0039061E8C